MAKVAHSTPPTSKVLGFGFDPGESEHHFRVTIPSKKDEHVYISEHFTWDDSAARQELTFAIGADDAKMRVALSRSKWNEIEEAVQHEFNQRLRDAGAKAGKWKAGRTPVSRVLGKELVLLAWAIEDADPHAHSHRDQELARPRARRTLVALHDDQRGDRACDIRPQSGMAQSCPLCAH